MWNLSILITTVSIYVILNSIARHLCSFFDFDGDFLTSCVGKILTFISLSPIFEMSIFNKLRNFFRFRYNLIMRSAKLNFSDNDSKLAYFRMIDFAKIIGYFDNVKRFNGLGSS